MLFDNLLPRDKLMSDTLLLFCSSWLISSPVQSLCSSRSKLSDDLDIAFEFLRARKSKLLRRRSIESSLANGSIASKLSDDLETRSVDFEIGFSSCLLTEATGFAVCSYSISLSKPSSVDLENQQLGDESRLSGDLDNRFDEDLLRGSFASSSSNMSEPLDILLDGLLATDIHLTSVCCSSVAVLFISALLRDAVVASRLSGDNDVALGFRGSFDSNSSKMSELRDSRLDDFLVTPIALGGSVGDGALLVDWSSCCCCSCCSKLSKVSSAMVGGIDGELGAALLGDVVVIVRRGGRRFFGRTEIR